MLYGSAVESLRLEHAASKSSGYVTVSVGLATVVARRDEPEAGLVALADDALYESKKSGRNRVTMAEAPTVFLAVIALLVFQP